jgi:hypothetical protein
MSATKLAHVAGTNKWVHHAAMRLFINHSRAEMPVAIDPSHVFHVLQSHISHVSLALRCT